MGVREMINQNRVASTVVLGLLIVGCAVWIWREAGGGAAPALASQRYYTDDDGKTFFADDAMKIVPFSRDGKEAVRAHVFECGETVSVHYIERFTEVGRKAAEASLAASQNKEFEIPDHLSNTAYEFKRPGETAWQSQPPGPKRCADGKQPEWVMP